MTAQAKPLASWWQAWWLGNPWLSRFCAVVAAALLCIGLQALMPQLLNKLQEHSRDLLWRANASTQPEQRVILVDIDDDSLQRIGPWPWSRQTMAQLTEQLDAYGASLKLFDIVFPDARQGDAAFSAALAAHDVTAPSLLAQVFALRGESHLHSGTLVGAQPGIGCQAPGVPAQGYIANTSGLHPRAGHITPTLDADGSVRRISAFVCADENLYPTLALAAVASLDTAPPRLKPGQRWQDPAWQLELPSLPGQRIGIDAQGQLRLPFVAARSALTRISAADLLTGQAPASLLQGAWIVIGSSAFGLADVVPTALGGAVGGPEIHMQLLLGLLDGSLPYTPKGQNALQLAYTLPLLAMLLLLAGSRRQRLWLPALALSAGAVAWGLHAFALFQLNWVIDWLPPALLLILSGGLLSLGEQLRLYAEKNRLYQHLSSYLGAPVAQELADSAPSSAIQARRCELTILAVDIKNFARYCQTLEPEASAQVLHNFYTSASALIETHGGVVQDMTGDGLLATFNGIKTCPEHPVAALQAARAIWHECSAQLPNTQALGLEPLSLGIGLESGSAMVGSFGPLQRRVHTVLGQTVTIALRLRALTPELAWPILLGPQLAQRLGCHPDIQHLELKNLGSFLLEGLTKSSQVHTLRHLLQPGSDMERRTLAYLHAVAQQHTA